MTRRALLALPLAAVAAPVVAADPEVLVNPDTMYVLYDYWDRNRGMTQYARPFHNPSGLWPPTIVAKILEEVRDVRE